MTSCRRWTQQDDDDLRTLRDEGWTWPRVAEYLDRSHGAVRVRAHHLGLTRRRRERRS